MMTNIKNAVSKIQNSKFKIQKAKSKKQKAKSKKQKAKKPLPLQLTLKMKKSIQTCKRQ